ncbi:MAG: peptidylprolyl isomerase [Acetobacteraceae bacterium]|nr:peptidylprolyl isomerase [Acetobacteraceae bacterium]
MTARSRSAAVALAVLVLAASIPARAADPTPAAIQDLSKPAFDTTTALYDMANRAEKSGRTVVAEVDGRAITLADLGDAIRDLPSSLGALPFEQLYPGVLERLIKQQALVIRAQHQGLDEDPVVRRRVKAAADHVLTNELLQREIGKSITEQALLDRYAQTVAGKPGPEEVRVRLIMVGTEAEATALIAELKAGGDFAAIAQRSSKDTTAPVGGDLGFVRRDGLNPEVGAVAFSQVAGQLTSYPVASNGAWFIVKTEERRQQSTPPFPVVRDRLRQELLRAGVPSVTEAAMKDVFAREYNITGKDNGGSETGSSTPN